MAMAMRSCYAFLLACRLVVALAADETGLVRLVQPEGTSSCSETYVCTTTGRSEVVLKFDGQVIFRRSHSQYAIGSGVNETMGDVTVGNLSRSEAGVCHDELRNTSDYCYDTMIVVRLTPNSTCRVIECTTNTFIDNANRVLPFGKATVAENRPLPQPTGLRFTHLSVEQVTFTWNPVTVNCSTLGYHYSISVKNCGSCPSRMNTTSNILTCEDLMQAQTCNISLQGVTECVASDSVSLSVQVPNPGQTCSSSLQGVIECTTSQPVTSPMTGRERIGPGFDVGAVVGGAVGGTVGGLAILIVTVFIMIIIVRKCDSGTYSVRNDDSEKGENLEILEREECKHPDTSEPDVSLDDGKDIPTVPMDQQALALNNEVGAVSVETPSTETTTEAAQETTADKGQIMIMTSASNGMSGRHTDAPSVATTRGVSFSPSVFYEPTPFTGQAGSNMDGDVLNPGYEKSSVEELHKVSDAVTDSDIERLVPLGKSVNISEPSRESEPSQPVGINGRGSSQFPSVKPSSENPVVNEYMMEQIQAELLKRQDERFAEQDRKIADQDTKIDGQDEKIKTLNTRVGELEARVKTLTEERELLRSKCKAIKQESDKKILQLTEERDMLKSRCADFEQKKEESATEISELCQKMKEMESKYDNYKRESDQKIDALKQELDMKQDELNKATEEWKHTEEKLKKLKTLGPSLDSQNTAVTPSKPDYRKCKSVPAGSTQYDF